MKVYVLPTCYKVDGTKEDIKNTIEITQDLSFVDYDGNNVPLGHSYDSIKGTLKIPRGYGLRRIQSKYSNPEIVTMNVSAPKVNNDIWTVKLKPFDYQEKIIETIRYAFLEESSEQTQFIIDLIGGKGKTLTSVMLAAEFGVPILIIVKTNDLMKQWYDVLMDKTSLRFSDVYQIKGTGSVIYAQSMTYRHPVYITTHASLRSIIQTYGYKTLNEMIIRMGIGLKIIDEFDTEFKNIIDIDLNTFIPFNLYLTATVYKNNSGEDKVFQNAFKCVPRIGAEFFKEEVPNRTCEWVNYKSNPGRDERYLVYSFNKEFSAYKYNDYLFVKKRDSVLIPLIKPYIDKFERYTLPTDVCVIFCEKKASCIIMSEILINVFKIPAREIGIINSDIDESEKKENFKCRYIISTAKSLGRGIDLKGIKMGLNLEQYSGTSIFEQQVFRLGRTGGNEGWFVNFIDCSYNMLKNWNRGKLFYTDKLFKEFKELYFDVKTETYVSSEDEL